jgi:hypothetical protein
VRQVPWLVSSVGRIAIKMGRPAGGDEGAYLNRYLTDEQPGRWPIFIPSLRPRVFWLVCRGASLIGRRLRFFVASPDQPRRKRSFQAGSFA